MGSKLENKCVKLYFDNENLIKSVQVRSMKSPLQCLAFSIFNTCFFFNIDLSVSWLPILKNFIADLVSKFFDFDNLGIHQRLFRYFEILRGSFICDIFASSNNFKILSFTLDAMYNPGLTLSLTIGILRTAGLFHLYILSTG